LFVKALNFIKVVRYKHVILLVKDAKPNQVVCYNREFVVTMIVITEFDCILIVTRLHKESNNDECKKS